MLNVIFSPHHVIFYWRDVACEIMDPSLSIPIVFNFDQTLLQFLDFISYFNHFFQTRVALILVTGMDSKTNNLTNFVG